MFQSRVFLEIRISVVTGSKAFCSCPAGVGNVEKTCPVCRQEPGGRPLLNDAAKKAAWRLARLLNCTIPRSSIYERFPGGGVMESPRLSQLSLCIAKDGFINSEFHCRKKHICIKEFRIEEDAGRLTHSGNNTRMDYTHAGDVSFHITTAPDFELGEEAELFLNELQHRIQYLELSPREPGELIIRCNAYVALARFPHEPDFYVKLRNLNSFNFVRKAINSELNRQEDILSGGGCVVSESRLWNERQNRTESFRQRDPDRSGRYIPADDIPVYECPADMWASLQTFKLETPSDRRQRFMNCYGFSTPLAQFICDEKSRADFFEAVVACGADPSDTARWLSSDVITLMRRGAFDFAESPLTPERFAWIVSAFHTKQIHSRLGKRLIQTVLEEALDPQDIIVKYKWDKISDPVQLNKIIDSVIAANPRYKGNDRDDPSGLIDYLTGIVMKETADLADPATVKEILKKKLNLNFIYVLAMGGALCGQKIEKGAITAGDEKVLKQLSNEAGIADKVSCHLKFGNVLMSQRFSEELNPRDWAHLIAKIAEILTSGTAGGIVITHGKDTLSYTAALLYWLFAGTPVPIVLAASSDIPGSSVRPAETLLRAVTMTEQRGNGIYVVVDDKMYPPLNLKFLHTGQNGFCNWNLEQPVYSGIGLLDDESDIDGYAAAELLQEAADHLFVCRVYPGLKAQKLIPVIEDNIEYLILELYDSGTGCMRDGPYSLKPLVTRCAKMNCAVFCTSQQNIPVIFSEYATAHQVWRKGLIPLQHLTTESAVALYFAASIAADTKEELAKIIEEKTF